MLNEDNVVNCNHGGKMLKTLQTRDVETTTTAKEKARYNNLYL